MGAIRCASIGVVILMMSPVRPLQAIAAEADNPIKLGPVQSFANEAKASAACPDGVVWADGRTGFYYPKFAPEYGVTPGGVFTCYKQAKGADYWDFGGADTMSSRQGRVFPLVCTWFEDKDGKWRCGAAGT